MKKDFPWLFRVLDPRMWLHDFIKWTGALPVVLYFRTKKIYINGKKPKRLTKGKVIIMANHFSFSDPIVVATAFWYRRVGFVATKDLFKNKLLTFLFKGYACVPVDKENVSMKTFMGVKEILRRGHSMAVFPEGGIKTESEVQGFKSGLAMMATISQADIVPTYICKRTKWWKRQRIYVGERIKLSDYINSPFPPLKEIEALTKVLYEREKELERFAIEKGDASHGC